MGTEAFEQQNHQLGEGFLERHFFSNWRLPQEERRLNWGQLELIVSPLCSHACVYCYLNRFKEELYPLQIRDEKKILENLKLVLDWLIANRMSPNIEFFSGGPLEQRVCLEALEMIVERYSQTDPSLRPFRIVVPTPYSFLLSEELTARIERLIAAFRALQIHFGLSASFDGKYCEQFRPLAYTKSGPLSDGYLFKAESDARTDQFYERAFRFNKKHQFGFHPMLYSRAMPYWKKNFLWFQENFQKFGLPPAGLYLLEVRNQNWTADQIHALGDFMEFLIRWAWEELCQQDISRFIHFIFRQKGFNILSNPLSTIGRGLGCSKQSALYLRLGDLAVVPCHREMYPGDEYGFLIPDERKVLRFKVTNPEKLIGYYSLEANNLPYCQTCAIKYLCSHGCLGSQLENTGDPVTPIPTICKMEHYKIYRYVQALRDLGVYDAIVARVSPQIKASLDNLSAISAGISY